MESYPTYDALAIDLDLHFFDKTKILDCAGKRIENGKWFVVTDDGHCHLFDKNGNLDDISKLRTLKENYVNKDIKKIIIPNSVTKIGMSAFFCCYNLKNITISNNVTSIGSAAFAYCSSLTHVVIPGSVKSIGDRAFEYCSGLTSIVIPGSVKSVENYMFYDCSGLTSIVIPGSVKRIGYGAFSDCSRLKSMTIPDSVKSIEYNAFYDCKNLRSLFFKGKTLRRVRDMNFYPWGIDDESIIKAELK